MTGIIALIAFVAQSIVFAPLLVLDREPMGKCQLIHYSKGVLRIPRCVAPGFEWAGSWRKL